MNLGRSACGPTLEHAQRIYCIERARLVVAGGKRGIRIRKDVRRYICCARIGEKETETISQWYLEAHENHETTMSSTSGSWDSSGISLKATCKDIFRSHSEGTLRLLTKKYAEIPIYCPHVTNTTLMPVESYLVKTTPKRDQETFLLYLRRIWTIQTEGISRSLKDHLVLIPRACTLRSGLADHSDVYRS